MATQLRVYTVKPGQLDRWVELFRRGTAPLREANRFRVRGWVARDANQFVWLVERAGSVEEFEAADAAYYRLPEHKPIHEEAVGYLEEGQSSTWFLEPVELSDEA